jgi:hypothetical protein
MIVKGTVEVGLGADTFVALVAAALSLKVVRSDENPDPIPELEPNVNPVLTQPLGTVQVPSGVVQTWKRRDRIAVEDGICKVKVQLVEADDCELTSFRLRPVI